MREELKKREGVRSEFTAAFLRYGWRRGYHNVRTALFIDVRDKRGELVTDHQWFVVGTQIVELDLKPYDRVCFVARSGAYLKGRSEFSSGGRTEKQVDYRLKDYRNMRRVSGEAQQGTLALSAPQVEAS